MKAFTRDLWTRQDQHEGDRWRLFTRVQRVLGAETALYPGSYVDVAPSFVIASVTYVDTDDRAARFFSDKDGLRELVDEHPGGPAEPTISFIHADYRSDLLLIDESFDLLISLYAGFVTEACARYLRVGGHLLVNPSHGDTALAAIDPRLELVGVVRSRRGGYTVTTDNLDTYLVPKSTQVASRDVEVTRESIHTSGRGIAYTRTEFAYLFERIK